MSTGLDVRHATISSQYGKRLESGQTSRRSILSRNVYERSINSLSSGKNRMSFCMVGAYRRSNTDFVSFFFICDITGLVGRDFCFDRYSNQWKKLLTNGDFSSSYPLIAFSI